MADLSIQPVATQIRPVQPMSLADMVAMARGVQAYQQAQQINPVELERAQAELSRLQQITPQEVRRLTAEALKAEKTVEPVIGKAKAEERTAVAQAGSAETKLAGDWLKGVTDRLTSMINHPLVLQAETNPDNVDKAKLAGLMDTYGREQANALGIPSDKSVSLIFPYVEQAIKDPANMRKFLQQKLLSTLDQSARVSALQPAGIPVTYGGGGQVTSTNIFGAQPIGTALPGTKVTAGVAPSTFTTETGAPGVFGGAPGRITNEPEVSGVAPAPARPAIQTKPQPTITSPAPDKISLAPGETYEAYKERTKRLGQLPTVANQAMNLANVESVPNMEYTNDKILKLLEKKTVDVGPIAAAVANKTGGIGLSSDQQEVMKYLEQRIRQQASRTDQDQNSLRSAFGSFSTNKEALMDILYNDKGTLASQRLFYSGIRKVQGDPTKPNFAAISAFENKFNDLNKDPAVAHLLGVIGNKDVGQLTQTDRQQLKKYFGGMSSDRIKDLFAKRDELIKLVEGTK